MPIMLPFECQFSFIPFEFVRMLPEDQVNDATWAFFCKRHIEWFVGIDKIKESDL